MGKNADERVDDVTARGPKRPYAKPKLQEYGHVAKLTQSGGSTRNEPAPKMKVCL